MRHVEGTGRLLPWIRFVMQGARARPGVERASHAGKTCSAALHPKSALVGKVPEALLPAAYNYLNVFDDDQSVHGFVSAFGELTAGSLAYQQVAWLAIYATGLVVPFWKHMCDGDAPEQIHSRLQAWLLDPTTEVDWETACTPCIASRSGEQVVDCDACRLEPIAEAVSSLANYLQTADPEMAAACLSAASSAFNEGCHPRALSDGFERWLVFEALPHAMKLEPPFQSPD